MGRLIVSLGAAAVLLSGCAGGDPDGGPATSGSDAGAAPRDALAAVTLVDGSYTTQAERAFIFDVSNALSRSYWDDAPELMALGYDVCSAISQEEVASVLTDRGWSPSDAREFVVLAAGNLC